VSSFMERSPFFFFFFFFFFFAATRSFDESSERGRRIGSESKSSRLGRSAAPINVFRMESRYLRGSYIDSETLVLSP